MTTAAVLESNSGLLSRLHEASILTRRQNVLAQAIRSLVPTATSLLDVGCGNGRIAHHIQESSRALHRVEGVDVQVRPITLIPVQAYDGVTLPYEDSSFDVVVLCDVLHHCPDPLQVLKEATRVSVRAVVVKDHRCEDAVQRAILTAMDWVGNSCHGVPSPGNYLNGAQWGQLIRDAGLNYAVYREGLGLYPWPISKICDGSIQFITRLHPTK